MKKRLLLLVLAALLCMCGCGTGAGETPPAQPTANATPAPGTLQGLDGAVYTPEELLQGHKLVMLNFWAYWCGPCVSEMPDLEKIHRAYAAQGLYLVGVYVDESDMQATRDVITQTGVTYPVVGMTAEIAALARDMSAIPTTLFLDETGTVIAKAVGSRNYNDWQQIIEQLLQGE